MARVKSGDGYWMVTPPINYKGKTYIGNRYVYEHRLLVEQKIGRLLKAHEVIDHINGNKLDNSIENLQILSKAQHGKKHKMYLPYNVLCTTCGKKMRVRPYELKTQKEFFCCRKHYCLYVRKNNWGRYSKVI